MDYYNIGNIEMEEEKAYFSFQYNVNLPDSYQNIKKNKKIKLPIFLTKLALENEHCEVAKNIVNELEKIELRIEPNLFNLKIKSNYFYKIQKNIYKSDKEELCGIFVERMRNFYTIILSDFYDEKYL
ncbi:hypothetical protein GVAV_000047 [Gurleya vavrai]